MPYAIETEHLTYIYGQGTPFELHAVEDVSLRINEGAFVGVIGHTGSGKSTLIQHLNGLLKPTSGRILIGGQDMWAEPKKIRSFRFQVGLVFQYPEYQLFEETVYKDMAYGPKNMGLKEEEIDKRVRQAAQFVGLKEELLQKSPFELSGGQKRRVAIAGVIAMNPKVLVLDEPTAGLDPKGRDRILGQLKEYHQEEKNTMLLVSHSMEDVAKYADEALVMNRSRLYCHDTVENVFARAGDMESLGLSIPQVTKVFSLLKAQGMPVSGSIYTVEQGVRELERLFGKEVHHA